MWMVSPGRKRKRRPRDRDVLVLQADQVHLDAPVARIVDGLVAEGAEVESGAELAVDAREQVEVERRRDAGGVVVGGEEVRASFLRSTPTIRRPPGDSTRAEDAQQALCLDGVEIADGRAGKNPVLWPAGKIGREGDRIGKIGDDRPHVERGKARGEARLASSSAAFRHIDHDVGAELRQLPSRISVLRLEPEPNSTSTPPSGTSAAISAACAGGSRSRCVSGSTRAGA